MHKRNLILVLMSLCAACVQAQTHELVCPNNAGAVYAQDAGFGTSLGWSAYQPSPPTYLLGVGGAERQRSSQRVLANGYGLVRYGFAIMEVSASVDNGYIGITPQSFNGYASAGTELRFRDRLYVQSPTLPDGAIVTVKVVAVTTRGTRIISTRYVDGSVTDLVAPNGTYTVRYQAATTNGLLMHSRQLTQADGSAYRIWITNAMVGGIIYLDGSVFPSVTINLSSVQNKNYEAAKDQCSVFITVRSLDTNVTLLSASGAVYPPEENLGLEVAPYGTNEFLVAAPAGMLLQTITGLGDDIAWSSASSNIIARLAFTNESAFFRAASP
jgi:hypothetical protein